MAAARANLLEVMLTPAAYEHLERLDERMRAGCDAVIAEHGLPAYTVGSAQRAASPTEGAGRRLFVLQAPPRPELAELVWLWSMNRGLFVTPGREQEWSVTVAHDDEAVDRYVEVFAELAAALSSTTVRLCSRMNCGR